MAMESLLIPSTTLSPIRRSVSNGHMTTFPIREHALSVSSLAKEVAWYLLRALAPYKSLKLNQVQVLGRVEKWLSERCTSCRTGGQKQRNASSKKKTFYIIVLPSVASQCKRDIHLLSRSVLNPRKGTVWNIMVK